LAAHIRFTLVVLIEGEIADFHGCKVQNGGTGKTKQEQNENEISHRSCAGVQPAARGRRGPE
jgi:hypothetical protein